jgi:putative chitinase
MELSRVIAAVAPRANASAWAQVLEAPLRTSGITTPNRIAMFLGQVVEESGDFRSLSEDLYYTTAENIVKTWPSHFADRGEAAPFICCPSALANRVYANRMGNGDEESGDGWRFRGRGLIQITGKTLYGMFARAFPRASDPDWLTTPIGAAVSACWFWTLPHPGLTSLNSLSDSFDIRAVTLRINGGLDGLSARQAAVDAVLRVINQPARLIPPASAAVLSSDELDSLYNPEVPA